MTHFPSFYCFRALKTSFKLFLCIQIQISRPLLCNYAIRTHEDTRNGWVVVTSVDEMVKILTSKEKCKILENMSLFLSVGLLCLHTNNDTNTAGVLKSSCVFSWTRYAYFF